MVNKKGLHNLIFFFAILLYMMVLTGCSDSEEKREIILTTGFLEGEVFRVENESCFLPELRVYLATIQNKYESVYGSEIWKVKNDDTSLSESIKENALADLSQIKAMNILANQKCVTLTSDEEYNAKENAEEFISSLSEHEISVLSIDEEIVEKMYKEYALAHKVYNEIIKGINPEISDDEARTITVQHIFFKTYTTDAEGQMIQMSDSEIQAIREKAEIVYNMATNADQDFKDLVIEYSDGDQNDLSFGKGTMDTLFEYTAFNLGKGEISNIVQSTYGFHIIKCLNTFNKTETDLNKMRIAQERREQVFSEQYDSFAKTLRTYLNEDLWDSVYIINDDEVNTQNFFEIYDRKMD